jgi:RNA polymerase sigma-70 factor (ECF subfamily)
MSVVPYNNEKVLFLQIAEGDEIAFRKIFDLYKTKLAVFIFRMTKSESCTEELVQDIFVKLWIKRSKLANVDNPRAYIFTIARNRTMDHLRKLATEAKLLNQVWQQISKVQNSTEEQLNAKESQELIHQALVQLSAQKQKIFQLSRYKGLNHEQIADHLSLSKSTVKNHIVETLRYIKTYLHQHSETLVIVFSFTYYKLLN